MAVCLILTLLPATALAAEGDASAAVGGSTGPAASVATQTITEDTTNLTSGTWTMSGDVTVKGALQVAEGANVTMDLGGNTLTLTAANGETYTGDFSVDGKAYSTKAPLINKGTLTIQNGTITFFCPMIIKAGIVNTDTGTLTIKDRATINVTSFQYNGSDIISNIGGRVITSGTLTSDNNNGITTFGGTVEITGGSITANGAGYPGSLDDAAALQIFSEDFTSTGKGANVTISGGELESYAYAASTNNQTSGDSNLTITGGTFTSHLSTIYWPSAGTVTVGNPDGTGPSLTSTNGSAVEVCSGTLRVQGGTLTGKGQTGATEDGLVSGYRGNSGAGGAGDALTIIARRGSGYDSADLNVTVTGGTFNTNSEYAIRYMDCNQGNAAQQINQDVMVSVSGGEFNGVISAVDASFVAAADQNFISGGDFSSNVSAYVAPNYECTDPDQDGTYTVSKMEDKLVVGGTVSGSEVNGTLEGTFGGSETTVEDNTSEDIIGSGEDSAPATNDVAIDLTTEQNTTSTTLNVTKDTAASLDKANSLTVKTDVADVKLDSKALSAVAQAKDDVAITVSDGGVTDTGVEKSYTVTAEANGQNLLPYGGKKGTVTITVKLPDASKKAANYQAWYVTGSADSWSYVEKLKVTDSATSGCVDITIDHLSTVVLLGSSATVTGVEAVVTDSTGKVTFSGSLADAITNADSGKTITLQKDVTENVTIPAGKDIVLDLNGKKITNSTATHTITVALGGKLTVQDTVGGGIVDNVSHGCAAIWNNGTADLNGGKYDRSLENGLSSSNPGGNSYYVLVNHGEMKINDGVTVAQNGHFSSMIENGYYSYNSGNASSGYVPDTNAEYPALTINGGSFSGGLNTVKNDDGGKLEIKGGNFSNVSQAVVLNWNEAEISGGTFTVTEAGVESVILNGYAAGAIDQGKLTITGGTFTSHTGAPVLTTMNNSAAQHSGTIEITGGTLNGDIVLTDPQAGGTLAISQGAVINGDIINRKVAAVTVTGGTVTGQVTNSGNGKITVTGGSFPNADVSGFVPDGSYTVTFNCAGGDPIPSKVVAKGTEIPLPGCTHSSYHYKFDGWKCGNATYYAGDKVEVNSNMTFTAQWKERFPDGPSSGGSSSVSDNEYAVTVDAGKHGDVSVSPKWAEEGDTVTITADPDNGYVVDEVIVTDKNGDDIRVRDRGDGEYTFTMPDSKVTVEVTFVEAGDELSFVDVAKSDYYYDAVKWAVENGVTTGVTDTIFAPGNPCTRAQTVTFLWRAAGMPQAANRVNPFTDVSVNDYYYEAVLWAVENGITGGTTATTFSPNATCTRAQVVTFLWRYSKEDASILPMFTDVAEGDYYYGAVAWAVENGVTTGVTDTSFVPGNPCTRGQIVTFLYRYMGK